MCASLAPRPDLTQMQAHGDLAVPVKATSADTKNSGRTPRVPENAHRGSQVLHLGAVGRDRHVLYRNN